MELTAVHPNRFPLNVPEKDVMLNTQIPLASCPLNSWEKENLYYSKFMKFFKFTLTSYRCFNLPNQQAFAAIHGQPVLQSNIQQSESNGPHPIRGNSLIFNMKKNGPTLIA